MSPETRSGTVLIYGAPNCQGPSLELSIGTYNHVHIRSAKIPSDMEIAVGADANKPLNLVMARGDSSGSDVSNMVWGHLHPEDFPLVIVRKKPDAPTGLLRGSRNGQLVWWYLPYGKSHGGANWLNDGADTLIIPRGTTARVWKDDTFQGVNTLFHGSNGAADNSQPLGIMAGQASAIELTADKLEAVGAPVMDWSKAEDLGQSTSIGSSAVLTNTSGTAATLSTEIGVEASSTAESNWQNTLTTGASITSQTTVGTGESSPVKVEESLSLEVHFEASMARGGSHSQSSSSHVTQTVEAECPPHSTREVQMLVVRKRQRLPIRQQMRNTVTGETSWLDGTITLDMATTTSTRVRDPEAA